MLTGGVPFGWGWSGSGRKSGRGGVFTPLGRGERDMTRMTGCLLMTVGDVRYSHSRYIVRQDMHLTQNKR